LPERYLSGFTLVVMVWVSLAIPQEQKAAPQRIVLNLTAQPSTSIAVTWRTSAQVEGPRVQIAEAEDWTDFEKHPTTVEASSEKAELDSKAVVYSHSAILRGLKPDTVYVYRVGADSAWSEWNQFRTAKAKPAPFDFVFLGDPQYEVKNLVARLFRTALLKAPAARFWLFTGDLFDLPQYDRGWEEWFSSTGFIHSVIPSILAPGSHEYALKTGDTVQWDVFLPTWKAHFTLPGNGPEGLEGRAYYTDYQGARFIVLDAQYRREEQSRWLDGVLANNPNRWTVVAFHEPVFSIAKDRDERNTRDAFMPLIDKYSVDVVLSGHDHGYARSRKLRNGKIAGEAERGTVYVVSVCGPQGYDHNPKYDRLMAKTGTYTQLFQVISLSNDALRFKAWTVTGKLYDFFELKKAAK
jgi:acid phosphatase type 7